jgi:general nucleoside transport system permease protein
MADAKTFNVEAGPASPKTRGRRRRQNLINLVLVPVLAVFTALLVGAVVIYFSGSSPLLAYKGLWEGAFGSPAALSETVVWTIPYIFAGLAVALAFNGGLFNLGADGQLAVGAVVAAWIGYALPQVLGISIPAIVHLPLALVGGAAAGMVWGAIPGWLKARTGASEVINTIMFNYMALLGASFLLNGVMKDPSPTNVQARTPLIAVSARIPRFFPDYRINWGLVLALIAAVVVWFLLRRLTWGFEIRSTGANRDAAEYAGINNRRTIVLTMALSGLLAGLAGAVEVTGLNYRHDVGFSAGYGFDAIAIALLGRNQPVGVVLAAFLFGAMRNGASRMQFVAQIPVDIISIVQALILLFVAADAVIRYIYRIRAPDDKLILSRGWGK